MIYLAGSLRNEAIPVLHKEIEDLTRMDVFSDWYAAGPEADDHWKAYYKGMQFDYVNALREPASRHVFNFDKHWMDKSDYMVLALPAGKSGHLELGYFLGQGKPGFILLDGEDVRWDVMYQFATGVATDVEHLANMILAEDRRK